MVRLDIWHLMRHFASGVTTESHQLYPAFMRQLSRCIFEMDPGDVRHLREAKRSQLEGKHGMVGLTDAEVLAKITKEEWRLHCRRRTRGAEETALLIQDLLDTFSGAAGRDALDIQLLDDRRILDIWSTQTPPQLHPGPTGCAAVHPDWQFEKGRSHPACLPLREGLHVVGVLPPPPRPLHPRYFTCISQLVKTYILYSHLLETKINSFFPPQSAPSGTRASAKYFQAFLVDGLVRWNEDRAAAAEGQGASLRSYCGLLKHVLNQKSQRVVGYPAVKDFTPPGRYTGMSCVFSLFLRHTNAKKKKKRVFNKFISLCFCCVTGELIGVEYLFRQTGKVLEDVSLDPDVPDETAAVEAMEDVDEGIEEGVDDPTLLEHVIQPATAATRSGDPADPPASGPTRPAAPASPEAPEAQAPASQDSSSDTEVSSPNTNHYCRYRCKNDCKKL